MAKFTNTFDQNDYSVNGIPKGIRDLFANSGLASLTGIGTFVSDPAYSSWVYFVVQHVSGHEILFQTPITPNTLATPFYYTSGSWSNHPSVAILSPDSPTTFWQKLYIDGLFPREASFWDNIIATPMTWFPELHNGQGVVDMEMHIRDSATDFDIILFVTSEGTDTNVKGAGVLSTKINGEMKGIATWYHHPSNYISYFGAAGIHPETNEMLGVAPSQINSFSGWLFDTNRVNVVRNLTASMDDNSATKDWSQTMPFYIQYDLIGLFNPDFIRFSRIDLARGSRWVDTSTGRKYTAVASGLLVGDLTDDPVYTV